MTVALTVKARHGLWVQHDGYEYPLVLIIVLTALALAGPGTLSIDHILGIDALPLWKGATASLLGILGGLAVRLLLHTTPTQSKDQ
jgi:putative oxidoreductase